MSRGQQLDLGGPQVDQGGLHIGFELDALYLQAVEVDLCDIAGLEAVAADFKEAIVELEARARDCHHGLLLQYLDEEVPQVEEQVALLVGELRRGDGGALPALSRRKLRLCCPLDEVFAGAIGRALLNGRYGSRSVGVS